MSVLVYIETDGGKIKKSSLEAALYASKIGDTTAVVLGPCSDDLAGLGKYGVAKVIHVDDAKLEAPVIAAYTEAFAQVAEQQGSTTLVFMKSSTVDATASRLSIKLGASIVSNIVELPDTSAGYTVKRSIYTGKGFAKVSITTDKKILVIRKGAVTLEEGSGSAAVETANVTLSEGAFAVVRKSITKAEGDILLPEAELVVSAGRGLKGPDNWGIIEELARTLGAATGCSKPVSDEGWRPHHEHVGQTGVKVSPNLYIAIGISGAIQHLAGVNSSKYIVVINTDAEAPFFKAADYGIVGDAFEVVPKLIEALKAS